MQPIIPTRRADTLPNGYVFDGELVALNEAGIPIFADFMFGRREPVFVPFDVLVADGENVTALPLKDRKALLTKIVRRYRLQKLDWVIGEGKAPFQAVCDLDLEGIVAKRLEDAYEPGRTRWWKIVNRDYSQKAGRAELFEPRYGYGLGAMNLYLSRVPAKKDTATTIDGQ
jgi:ATP-dependent DNA ligase